MGTITLANAQAVIDSDRKYREEETLRTLDKGIFLARVMPQMVGKKILQAQVPELNEVLADEYMGVDTRGQVITREQELERSKESTTKRITSMQVVDCEIQTFESVAVVKSVYKVDDPYDYDWYPTGDYRVANVYRKLDGKWYLNVSHWTTILAPDASR